jgi:hypothetical protein
MSWVQEIQTGEMTDWAYSTARSIIAAVGAGIPEDPPRTAAIEMLKRATQNIPAQLYLAGWPGQSTSEGTARQGLYC